MISGKDKKEQRKHYQTLRSLLPASSVETMSTVISGKLNELLQSRIGYIASYFPINKEVAVHPINQKLADENRLLLPYTNKNWQLDFYLAKDLGPSISTDTKKIPAPNPDICQKINPEEIAVILVPGIAFDPLMNRIGYGKGCYDSFLPKVQNALKIGITYDYMIAEYIAANPHDIRVDMIITDRRIIKPEK